MAATASLKSCITAGKSKDLKGRTAIVLMRTAQIGGKTIEKHMQRIAGF